LGNPVYLQNHGHLENSGFLENHGQFGSLTTKEMLATLRKSRSQKKPDLKENSFHMAILTT
jgi:hypothetical protein